MRCMACVVAFLASVATAASAVDEQDIEIEKLVGHWKVVGVDEGKGLQKFQSTSINVVICDDKSIDILMKVPPPGAWGSGVITRIDPTASPPQVDIRGTAKEKGETVLGIYELSGDKLMVRFIHEPGQERPTEFKGTDQMRLWVLEREIPRHAEPGVGADSR